MSPLETSNATSVKDEKTTGPYAVLPLPNVPADLKSDPLENFAYDMTLIHNVFIRGVNSVWINAPLVKPKDAPAFAGYVLSMLTAIHGHHHGEETIIFPFLSKNLNMERNVEQHREFDVHLGHLQSYIKDVQKKKITMDADKVRELVANFANPLVQHLGDEIPTITPEKLRAFTREEFDEMMKLLHKHIKNESLSIVFPFVIGNHDISTEANWPPVPPPIRWFARNLAARQHASYWKFASFDLKGRPLQYRG